MTEIKVSVTVKHTNETFTTTLDLSDSRLGTKVSFLDDIYGSLKRMVQA